MYNYGQIASVRIIRVENVYVEIILKFLFEEYVYVIIILKFLCEK